MSTSKPPTALVLAIPPPRGAAASVCSLGASGTERATSLGPLVDGLTRRCGARARALGDALARAHAAHTLGWSPLGEALASSATGVPALGLVVQWYQSHAAATRRLDPVAGRLADELVTLRSLVRDVEHTARCLGHDGDAQHALALAWIAGHDGEVAAAISYTDDPARSFARKGRVPYVYNVWSGARGHGATLLRFVAQQTGGRPLVLHPLHDGVAAHYIRVHGAQPDG